ncbi:hypothetical protein [Pukyongiella litopenaei]|uniref:Uncharacterized protein n=1 Tax=Pukyongiella litopenaei TaxID=2605946 RepID=A0A2S0ML63_9RHOB|nr:hypothetical protein [Pukyongiella litopenaei]AVO36606.1 hypothetical protein C6Y53_02100 [Pukyongiella litopenaei]
MGSEFKGRDLKVAIRAAIAGRGRNGDLVDPISRKSVSMTEAQRVGFALGAIRDRSAVPGECGDAIPAAPARGPMRRFVPREMVPDGEGGHRSEHMGYRGRDGARCADVFDVMTLQARRAQKGGSFEPPFTFGQVQAGRGYAALFERCAAAGVGCSSLETLRRAAAVGGDREAAIFADFARLRVLQRRIGDGLVKEVRRIRPGGQPRRAIYARRLVDLVCVADMPLGAVLREHGWADKGAARDGLRAALCAALDRMQGYDLARPQDVG